MTINEFLRKYRKQRNGMQILRPRVRCAELRAVELAEQIGAMFGEDERP